MCRAPKLMIETEGVDQVKEVKATEKSDIDLMLKDSFCVKDGGFSCLGEGFPRQLCTILLWLGLVQSPQGSRQLSGPAFQLGVLGLIKLPRHVCRCKTNLVIPWNVVTERGGKSHSPSWPASGLQSGPALLWTFHRWPGRKGIKDKELNWDSEFLRRNLSAPGMLRPLGGTWA